MAKVTQIKSFLKKNKIKRKGKHSKKTSTLKSSKNYVKLKRGQGK